jgi:hypothetical protein
MLGIENYNPHFYTSTKELLDNFSGALRELIGKRILEVWVVWDSKNDEWFKDCPVVLNIEGIQMEICTSKIDEIAITFNTINLSEGINWFDIDDFALEWREGAFSDLLSVKNKQIKNIEVIESKLQSEIVFSIDIPNSQGDKSSSWVLNGIGFELDNGYFSVYNNIDENEISTKLDVSDYIRKFKVNN